MANHLTSPRSAVRRLAAARLISLTGTEAAFIALVYAVYQRTGSAAWVSAALFLTFGTLAAVSPLSGALGDRFDRRRVMIGSDLSGAACFGALAFAHRPVALLVLAFLSAAASAPFLAASDAAVPNLVGPGELAWANGTVSFGAGLGFLIGPALGGLLVSRVGVPAVFFMNAASFVLSAAIVSTVRADFALPGSGEEAHRGLRAGFAFLMQEPAVRRLTVAFAVFTLSVGAILVAELPLAKTLGVGAVGYGLLSSFFGLGALGGSLAGRRLNEVSEKRSIVLCSAVTAAGLGSVAVLPAFAPILGAMLVSGASDGLVDVAALGIIQRRTPDAVRSRVLAAVEGAILATFALSFLFAGALVDAVGPKAAYAIAGAGCSITTVVLWPLLREAGGIWPRRRPVAVGSADVRGEDATG